MSTLVQWVSLPLCCLTLHIVCQSAPALADEAAAISLPALTAEEQAALNQIQESRVLSTVAFLASDEMAGRNTPSPELTIASAYVAARFRGAGLEPLGPDGSYFQRQELSQYGPPASPAQLQSGTAAPLNVPVIFAADRPVQLSGPASDPRPGSDQSGQIIILDEPPLPPQAADSPAAAAATVARRIQPLLQSKPAAVLIRSGCQQSTSGRCRRHGRATAGITRCPPASTRCCSRSRNLSVRSATETLCARPHQPVRGSPQCGCRAAWFQRRVRKAGHYLFRPFGSHRSPGRRSRRRHRQQRC
ncbi:MAG UNVERIFIED_CONTAM: hypothetical protein LVR18_45675 [Planctomycetaceae bacterium]